MESITHHEAGLFFPSDRSLSPASARRVVNLVKLLREVELHPLRLSEIASLLGLTHPGARKYARQLRDIGILQAVLPDAEVTARMEKVYRLSTNQALVRRCWAELLQLAPRAAAAQSAELPVQPWTAPAGEPHRVYRDPLVSALFGNRIPSVAE
ncbi:hypothetical protein ACXZ1M_19655 [Duganella sp. PWIR1]|jgi:hypothetical protein